MLNKKHSKGFFIRLISGITLGVIAIVATLSIMIPSKVGYDKYYKAAMEEKKQREYLNSLPLELKGITAELADTVKYYDNNTAEPVASDFVVKATFSEKGREYTKKLAARDYTISVPEDFAKKGGTITVSYVFTPEKKDGETTDPEPVTKTADVAISLVQPDETVFVVTKVPTFEEAGYAENNKGVKKNLPILNKTDYEYTFDAKTKAAKFKHIESELIITVYVSNEIILRDSIGKSYNYNNIDCHFATDIEGLKIAFKDGGFVLSAEEGKTITFGSFETDKVVFSGSGLFEFVGNVKATTLTVKAGANVNVTGNVTIREEMLVESGATFNITAKTDTLYIENDGKLKLYGSMTLTDATGGHAAIYLKNNSTLDISKDTRINIVNYTYAIGKFVNNNDATGRKANIEMPYSAALVDKSITLAKKKLIDASTCEKFYTDWSIVLNKKEAGKYSVVEEPTFTKTGLAQSDGGDEMILPILNAANYNFTQKTKDGKDYLTADVKDENDKVIEESDYKKGTPGTATFTHKTNPEIVIEKEITADTITFNWADYNNVDIHWIVASRYKGKMTGAYVDGTYVLTLLNGVTIDIPNLDSLNSAMEINVKITGDGILNVTKETEKSSFVNVTVDNVSFTYNGSLSAKSITVTGDKAKATLNKTFNGSVIVKAGELTINEQLAVPANGTVEVAEKATLNVTASSGDVVRLGSNTEGVTADLFGTVNITYNGTTSQTGLWLGVGSVVNLGDESRVAIKGADYSVFVQQNGTSVENAATLYYPSGATLDKDNKKITNKDGKVIFDYDNNVLRLDFKQK